MREKLLKHARKCHKSDSTNTICESSNLTSQEKKRFWIEFK